MDRRQFLSSAGAGLATVVGTKSFAGDDSSARLVFVHGRSQQGLDPDVLKATWLDTLKQGAAKINRTLPPQLDVAFPFYGDKLDEFAREFEIPLTTDIQTKGSAIDNDFLNFQAEVAEQMRSRRVSAMPRYRNSLEQIQPRKACKTGLGFKRLFGR
jgi:hypothetical protein